MMETFQDLLPCRPCQSISTTLCRLKHCPQRRQVQVQTQLTFAGFQLSEIGYQIDESISEAIPNPNQPHRFAIIYWFG